MMRKSVLFLYKNSAIQKEKTDEKVEKDIDIHVSIDDGAGVWGNYGAGGYDILFKIKRNAVKQKWIPASSEQ